MIKKENPAARVALLKTAKTLIVALNDEQIRRLLLPCLPNLKVSKVARKNELQPLDEQKALQLFKEAVPSFEEAAKLFYANEKARNILKRTIEWHLPMT